MTRAEPNKIPKVLRMLGWAAIAAAGAASVAVLALARGESVSAIWMVVAATCTFALAYRFHAAWLMARVLTVDELRATPAEVHADGRDFVKTNRLPGPARSWARCSPPSSDTCRASCGY
jgi:carbon starvation protein